MDHWVTGQVPKDKIVATYLERMNCVTFVCSTLLFFFFFFRDPSDVYLKWRVRL